MPKSLPPRNLCMCWLAIALWVWSPIRAISLCVMANTGHVNFEVRNAIVVVALTLAASAMLVRLLTWLRTVLWEPLRLKRFMAKQGVGGPPFRFLVGNLPEVAEFSQSLPEVLPLDDKFGLFSPTVTPHYALYFPEYGTQSTSWHWGYHLWTLNWRSFTIPNRQV